MKDYSEIHYKKIYTGKRIALTEILPVGLRHPWFYVELLNDFCVSKMNGPRIEPCIIPKFKFLEYCESVYAYCKGNDMTQDDISDFDFYTWVDELRNSRGMICIDLVA